MGPLPKTRKCQPNKDPTCFKYEFFMCHVGPHGSGHHLTPIE